MILYHGSNLEIEAVDLTKCRPFKDFGRGFYLTDIKEQAFKMAQRVARIYGGAPVVNVYETDLEKKPYQLYMFSAFLFPIVHGHTLS